jgi:glycosyltransferase involved in cell wall biosynthesis
MTAVRVTSFPAPGEDAPPYIDLLHAALARHDVTLLPPTRLGPGLARRGPQHPDSVHLHWIEYLVRSDGEGAQAAARATARAVRLAAALAALRRRGVGIVWTVHNLRPHEATRPRLEAAAMHATARAAHRIVVHSRHAVERVASVYGQRDKLEVVPHGHFIGRYPPPRRSREELRAALGLDPGAFAFLVFGQLRRYKRIPETIAALRALGRDDVRLIVAGSAWDAQERTAVERAAAGDPRVVLRLGFVPDEDVTELHLAADAAVLAYRELFSSGALLLALSLGVPTVVPSYGGALETAAPPAVVAFAEGALVDALEAMTRVDHERARAAALAAARAADWDAIGSRTAELYRAAAHEATGGG